MPIHQTAIVDRTAEIDATADIGPYAIIEPQTRIGAGTRVYPHAYIAQYATIGARCEIHPYAVVGHVPQDLAFEGAPSYATVGDDCVIREGATIHRGTMPDSTTRVGNHCFLMANSHVGHNCEIADRVILANGALLSGHVQVGPRAFVSGNVTVHQFVRVGELVMCAGLVRVPNDVPPFMMVAPEGVVGPNVVGLRRAGLDNAERLEIRKCHRMLYRSGLAFPAAIENLETLVETEPGRRLLAFLKGRSKRGFMGGRRRVSASDEP